MNSNEYYRIRKEFSDSDSVETVNFEYVNRIPEIASIYWKYTVGRQTVSAYVTGDSATLIVFDNVEGPYSYCAKGGQDFKLYERLRESDADVVVDISGERHIVDDN
mgnify:CR=1 FL=1